MADTVTEEQEVSARSGRPPSAALPPRVTLPLLSLVTESSLDEDYRHVAERRAAAGASPTDRGSRHRGAAVVVAVFGILIATAAVQTSRNADVDSASRTALTDRIDQRRESVASLQDRIRELRAQNSELAAQFQLLADPLRDAQARRQTLRVITGFVAVQGPGLRVTVDDASSGEPEGRVRATDLRLLVNGLWEAGAEAIAINGRRLTALSAIVNSGITVKANRSELTPPYLVEAIGDTRRLQADLLATTSGVSFQALADTYGFVVQRQDVNTLSLPAAPASQLALRSVEAADADDPDNQKEESGS
jgi:uncharacterized protein YlxW (UPF0749 family)